MFNVFSKVNHNGGITVDRKGIEYKGIGYAVAISKHTEIVIREDLFFPELIDQVMAIFKNELKQDQVFLGIWKDDNKIYFDLSEVIHDKDQAIKIAKERDQLGIFDFNTMETIETK